MTDADKAFVEQSQKWIENQTNCIAYNDFLIGTYAKQIAFLKKRVELETAERDANLNTLEQQKKQLEQFFQERQ